MKSLNRPNMHCPFSGKGDSGAIILSRFLHDQVWKALSLPVPVLWQDILLDERDTLLSAATPSRHF